ncbi:MAG: 16S rRNA (guanine(527)-N(7))-methyltransferase RsmG [Planctomycetota bacterium]|jgi:16S rRNA (guanine527-N7)-methyltransferase
MTEGAPARPEPLPPPPRFVEAAGEMGIEFDGGDLERLGRYLALLLARTREMNLTSITDPDEAWERHVLDALTLMPLLAGAGAGRVIDVGSGGGVPGVPLAVAMPGMAVTLLEATGKKARFLEEVVAALGLSNVVVVNDRAETIGHDRERHREQYDVVVARAVGRLPVLLELTVPLARVGGLVLAIKGARADEEIADARGALHALHAAVIDTVRTSTGTVVVIEKRRRTPRSYPRRPGEPKRRPLA